MSSTTLFRVTTLLFAAGLAALCQPRPASAARVTETWGTLKVVHSGEFRVVIQTNNWIVAEGGTPKSVLAILEGASGQRLVLDDVRTVKGSRKLVGSLSAILIGTITNVAPARPYLLRELGYRPAGRGVALKLPEMEVGLAAAADMALVKVGTLRRFASGSRIGTKLIALRDIGGSSEATLGWIGMPPELEGEVGLGRTTIRRFTARGRIGDVIAYAKAARAGGPKVVARGTPGTVLATKPDDWNPKSNVTFVRYEGPFPELMTNSVTSGSGSGTGGTGAGSSTGTQTGGGQTGGGATAGATGGGTGGGGVSTAGGSTGGSSTGTTGTGSTAGGTVAGSTGFSVAAESLAIGTVSRLNGAAAASATVRIGDRTVRANQFGYYTLFDFPRGTPLAFDFSQSNELGTIRLPLFQTNISTECHGVAMAHQRQQSLMGNQAVFLTNPRGAEFQTGADAFVDAASNAVAGNIAFTLNSFSGTNTQERAMFPGDAVGLDGATETMFRTRGFMHVSGRAGTNQINLAPGTTADVKFPPDLTSDTNVAFWHFDTASMGWRRNGDASQVGGEWTGSIDRMGWWSAGEVITNIAYVQGQVLATNGTAVPGAIVQWDGLGWTRRTYTDGNGRFGPLAIEAGADVTAQVRRGISTSGLLPMTSPAVGVTQDMGVIEVPYAILVTVTLTWGQNPADLDSHLTFPSGAGREHIYYADRISTVGNLDTDDTSGFGPEVISIFDLRNGVYRYSVHHYSGSSTISMSGASALLLVETAGFFRTTPPAGAIGPDDVWAVFDATIVSNRVVSLDAVGTFRHNVDASDVSAFSP